MIFDSVLARCEKINSETAMSSIATADCLGSEQPCGPEQYDMRALYELCSVDEPVERCLANIDRMAAGTRRVGFLHECAFVAPAQYADKICANYQRYGWEALAMPSSRHSAGSDMHFRLKWNENKPLIGRRPALVPFRE